MDNDQVQRQKTSNTPENVPFRVIFQIYLLSLNITLMVLSIISYCQIIDVQDYFYNINHNWNLLPIKSIRSTQGDCLQNEELINYYIWPGTVQGCDCRFDDHYIQPRRILYTRQNSLLRRECNSSMKAAGCEDIDEMSSRDFKRLPVEYGNKKLSICGQREEGNNSFAQNSPKVNECKENELKCGTVSDYFYCTKEKECPIFQMKNTSNVNSDSFQILRENDKTLPLVEFKIAQGDGVCRKVNERSITSGRSNYELISDPGYDCERDPRFRLIYLFNEFNFFQVNDALDIAKEAPGYQISSQYQWALYGRHYINFTLNCRQYQQEFMDSADSFEDIENKQLILMIISIICVLVFIFMLILNFCTICGVDLPCIKGKGTQESNTLFFIQFFLKESTQLANAIIIIINFATVSGRIDFFQQLIDKNCSDKFTQDEFQMILDVLKTSIYTYNLVYIILFFIGAFIDFFVGIFLAHNYYQERKRLNEQNQQQDKYKDTNRDIDNKNQIELNKNFQDQEVYNPYPQNENNQNIVDPFYQGQKNDVQFNV